MFDKGKFAELLNKAKGDLSINEYGHKSGVSAAHISRFLRSMLDVPPNPETIKKLALHARNGVRYEDLMNAAGHLRMTEISQLKILTKEDILTYVNEYMRSDNNSWIEKEMLLKEIAELYWGIKFKIKI